jgi:hypothetical protein
MADAVRQIHLLVERLSAPQKSPDRIEVPAGVCYLSPAEGQPPHLSEHAPPSDEQALVLETVQDGRQTRLLVLSPAGQWPRVNGRPAPRLALLGERDQLQLSRDDHVLHVTVYHRPYLGPPPEHLLGKDCPVCRVPLLKDTRVYVCTCGAAVHAEGDEKSKDDRLECLQLSPDCPVCNTPVVLL